jgi:CheY-like chemotaxis protein
VLFPIDSQLHHKRVLIVSSTCVDTERRSEYLRLRGYEVDCACNGDIALKLSRTRDYDLIVLALDSEDRSLRQVAEQLQRFNPRSTVTCLADCKKPIPILPCHGMLWKGEPLEYFAARVEALSAA